MRERKEEQALKKSSDLASSSGVRKSRTRQSSATETIMLTESALLAFIIAQIANAHEVDYAEGNYTDTT